MSLGKKLVQSAQKEAALNRPLPLQASASESIKGGEMAASAIIADSDRYAKMTSEIRVKISSDTSTQVNAPVRRTAGVEDRARKFAEGATYLTEHLAFVETDCGGTAVVRSTPQTMSGKGSPYFEAQIRSDEFTLRRFQAGEGIQQRTQLPFALTDDILARVVEDATETLRPKK